MTPFPKPSLPLLLLESDPLPLGFFRQEEHPPGEVGGASF